jgi:hypothetical protein
MVEPKEMVETSQKLRVVAIFATAQADIFHYANYPKSLPDPTHALTLNSFLFVRIFAA